MRADEARQKTDKARNVSIDSIISAIKLAAEQGKDTVDWHIPHLQEMYVDNFISKLTALGYRAKRITYHDQRESCDYLKISW